MKRRRVGFVTIKTLFRQYTSEYVPRNFEDTCDVKDIFMCEACLLCLSTMKELREHSDACLYRYWIPGDEICRCSKKRCVVFEIDGRKPASVSYTRRIAQIAKFFLEEKTTVDDLHFFSFIVLFEVDDYGYHFAGYFSREWKRSVTCDNSLSCVMVLPPYRSNGYGVFLIEISYEMGRIEGAPGTPERPLSRTGKCVFRRIWREELLRALHSLIEK
ncbi:putative acetyltransferase, partial [Trypanosoma grayi]|uniref:putative acetyltransferase n=1 Tax=Trypanosoma grayi TaxID=71804 RepID=UPI0004F3F5DD